MSSAFGLEIPLGETIDALRDTVRKFAAKEIAPRAKQIDEENLFPADLWKKLGDLGVQREWIDGHVMREMRSRAFDERRATELREAMYATIVGHDMVLRLRAAVEANDQGR